MPRPALFAFLGSTIGNFYPPAAIRLLARVRAAMEPGDRFLMGVDLRKDVARIEAAYNDSPGRHRRVQPQHAAGAEPRAGRGLRSARLRAPGLLRARGAPDRDAPRVAREPQTGRRFPGIGAGAVRERASRSGPRSAASTTARAWRSCSRPRGSGSRPGAPTRNRRSGWWWGRRHEQRSPAPRSRPISREQAFAAPAERVAHAAAGRRGGGVHPDRDAPPGGDVRSSGDGRRATLPFLRRYGARQGWTRDAHRQGHAVLPRCPAAARSPSSPAASSSTAPRRAARRARCWPCCASVVLPLRAAAASEGIDAARRGHRSHATRPKRAPLLLAHKRYARMAEYLGRDRARRARG